MHRSNDGYVVRVRRRMLKYLAHLQPRLAILFERVRRRQCGTRFPFCLQIWTRQHFANVLLKGRLWVECIKMRRTTVHKQMDHMLRLDRSVRLLGSEWIDILFGGGHRLASSASTPARPSIPIPIPPRSSNCLRVIHIGLVLANRQTQIRSTSTSTASTESNAVDRPSRSISPATRTLLPKTFRPR